MGAATMGRVSTVQSDVGKPIPFSFVAGVKTLTTIYQGTLVSIDSTGYAVPASAAATQKVVGVCSGPGNTGTEGDVDNSTGADAAKTVRIKQGAFYFVNLSTSIAVTDIGKPCYAATDQEVSLSSAGGTRPFAGIILGVDSTLGVLVLVGAAVQYSSVGITPAINEARGVITSALAAYTRVAGVITADANGAIGAVMDGLTPVAGDVVFLPEGIAAAASDAGPYVCTSAGAGGAKFVLTRPSWYADASLIPMGLEIKIGTTGTLFHGTILKSFVVNAAKVVGTDAPLFYPNEVIQSVALVAGTKTITNVPVRSSTTSSVKVNRIVGNTCTLTVGGYCPTNGNANGITIGALGTASVIIEACVGAGTINNADISTVSIDIRNW